MLCTCKSQKAGHDFCMAVVKGPSGFCAVKRRTFYLLLVVAVVPCIWYATIFLHYDKRYNPPVVHWNARRFNTTWSANDNSTNFIVYTVKTSKQFHVERLEVLMKTWIRRLKSKVKFRMDLFSSLVVLN